MLSLSSVEDDVFDTTLIVGDKVLYARKVVVIKGLTHPPLFQSVLASRIPYFYSLSKSNMAECRRKKINLSSELCGENFIGYIGSKVSFAI